MSFKDKLREQYIVPEIQKRGTGDLAVILNVDSQSNCASIKIENSKYPGDGEVRDAVPLPYMYGIETVAPSVGDVVYVQYRNGDRNQPYIVAIYPISAAKLLSNKSYSPPPTTSLANI